MDLPCDCSNEALFKTALPKLPSQAMWITTPLQRTAQTQAGLFSMAARLGVRLDAATRMVEPRFMEQNLGHWQGCSRDEIDLLRQLPRSDYWLAGPRECPPAGESFVALAER